MRPTSETIVNTYFAKWIQSYRDLPLLVNQWANVVRWELRPRVFLRTTEFLWQEGHTCHATYEDARDYAAKILSEVYADFMVNVLAMPVLPGRKTARERFPGAINTLTVEAMMGDGKALQMGTSHELGQNFAKVFETQYSSESGALEYVWQTSWGSSTRMVGGLIMCHGDDAGLRVPPRLAPIQVVVLLVRGEDGAGEAADRLARELRGVDVRTEIDTRTDLSFGRRVVDWELKGVPVRVEVGPRDLASGVVTLARRDSGAKDTVAVAEAAPRVLSLLEHIQGELLAEATARLESRTAEVSTVEEAVEAAADGFARLPWVAVGAGGEDRMRADGVTVRCLRREDGSVPLDEAEPGILATVGRAY